MNRKPVSYLQTDPRWKNKDYSAKGEKTTIGRSGCGPTCAAMLIETLTGKTFTPADACSWAQKRGYKAANQGTYYSYFKPQFAAYGLSCEQLNWSNAYGKKNDPVHAKAFALLKQGYYLIACMGKGLWTSSGHFIVVWWEDGKVKINDPNSTASNKTNADLNTFKSQVKYYFAVDARKYNQEGDDDMTKEDVIKIIQEYEAEKAKKSVGAWAKAAWEKITKKGVMDGTRPKSPVTREQIAVILDRLGLL